MISARLGLVPVQALDIAIHGCDILVTQGLLLIFLLLDHTLDQHQDIGIVDLIDLDRLQFIVDVQLILAVHFWIPALDLRQDILIEAQIGFELAIADACFSIDLPYRTLSIRGSRLGTCQRPDRLWRPYGAGLLGPARGRLLLLRSL